MPIDASIPLQYRQPQFESPINKLAQVMQLQGMQDQQMERQAARDEQNRLKTLLASPTDDLGAALTRGGFLPQAQAYAKTQAEIAKAKREEQESLQRGQKFDFERTQGIVKEMNGAVSSLLNDPASTPEMAVQEAMRIGKLFNMPEQQLMGIVQAIPKDAVQFRDYLKREAQRGLSAEQRLTAFAPKPVEVSTGGVKFFVDQNPQSPTYGQRTSAPEVKMEQSPDNLATNTTSEANNRRTVGAQYANAQATRDAAKLAADAARETANVRRTQDTEMKLADDYRAQSKNFKEVADAAARVKSVLPSATKSAASTLSAATSFMKLLDPGSVVRESELVMALQATGALDRALNYVNTLQNGKTLTASQVADFNATTDKLLQAAKEGQKKVDASYKAQAEKYQLRPEMIIQELGQSGSGKVIDFGSLP